MLVEDKGTREEDEKEQGQANELPISCLRPLCFVHPRSHKGSYLKCVAFLGRLLNAYGCNAVTGGQ
ncbi:hypothetical protein, partial [Collinsella bouchesdurhonensis]|uniref:hypothetical protein n=1 Tax=Collinsella bouchesdurhonensis TaxID=1907654 RepID=UPI001BB1BCE5